MRGNDLKHEKTAITTQINTDTNGLKLCHTLTAISKVCQHVAYLHWNCVHMGHE